MLLMGVNVLHPTLLKLYITTKVSKLQKGVLASFKKIWYGEMQLVRLKRHFY